MTIETDTDNIGRVILEQAGEGRRVAGTFVTFEPTEIPPEVKDAPLLVRVTFDE